MLEDIRPSSAASWLPWESHSQSLSRISNFGDHLFIQHKVCRHPSGANCHAGCWDSLVSEHLSEVLSESLTWREDSG